MSDYDPVASALAAGPVATPLRVSPIGDGRWRSYWRIIDPAGREVGDGRYGSAAVAVAVAERIESEQEEQR